MAGQSGPMESPPQLRWWDFGISVPYLKESRHMFSKGQNFFKTDRKRNPRALRDTWDQTLNVDFDRPYLGQYCEFLGRSCFYVKLQHSMRAFTQVLSRSDDTRPSQPQFTLGLRPMTDPLGDPPRNPLWTPLGRGGFMGQL